MKKSRFKEEQIIRGSLSDAVGLALHDAHPWEIAADATESAKRQAFEACMSRP